MSTISATEVYVKLPLPESVLQKYEIEAREYEVPIEELLANRLSECVDYRAAKPIYIDDSTRRELDTLTGRNLSKPSELVSIVRRLVSVRVNGVSVTLAPGVLERLRTRHFGNEEFGKWLEKTIGEQLEQFVGMR